MTLPNYRERCCSDSLTVFSLGMSSCDLRLISVSEGRRAIFSPLYHQCFHALKLFLIYISFPGGNTHLLPLTVLPITSPLTCILFLFMWYWRLWMPPFPLCSFSSLCHVMTVRASKAAMVLISRDYDCDGDDWAVLLGSAKSLVLSWLIRRIPFFTLPYNLFVWIWNLNVCCCWVCFFVFVFFTSLLSYCTLTTMEYGLNIQHLIISLKHRWNEYQHDVLRNCYCNLMFFLSDLDYIQTQAVFTHQQKYQSSQNAYLTTD